MLPLMVAPKLDEPVAGMISRWLPTAQYESVSPPPTLDVVVMLVPASVYVPVSPFDCGLRVAAQVQPPPAAGEQWIDASPSGGEA